MTSEFVKKCLRALDREGVDSECRRCVRRDRIFRRVLEIDDPCEAQMRRDEDEMTRDLARRNGEPR